MTSSSSRASRKPGIRRVEKHTWEKRCIIKRCGLPVCHVVRVNTTRVKLCRYHLDKLRDAVQSAAIPVRERTTS